MSTDKDDIDVDDDFSPADSDTPEAPVETSRSNLNKRRTIDNLLEERRLQKRLADYDYDL